MRKPYLDNLRWGLIVLVVLFHVFFYFNNIGVKPLFKTLPEFTENTGYRASSVYQYAVYPWFMLVLFVIAGMSSRYALTKRTPKEYAKERTRKLLVPSTLGVLLFGWTAGSIILTRMSEGAEIPKVFFCMISVFSGIGALWFLQALFVASMILLLVRKIDTSITKDKTETLLKEWKMPTIAVFAIIVLMYFPIWGSANILNIPVITSYRMGIYTLAFLLGYYVFSRENVLEVCEKFRFLFLAISAASIVYYIYRSYGTYYADVELQKTWYYNLAGYFMTPALLGLGRRYFNKSSKLTEYFKSVSWGVYILHIPILVMVGNLLDKYTQLSIMPRYLILIAAGYGLSVALYELLKRIPVIRYMMFGISKKKN